MSPLQRHKALVPLSQDHHHGLMLVLKIKKGIQYGVAPGRMAAYLLHVFNQELQPHFNEEEQGIFLWLDTNSPLLQRALREHQEMTEIISQIENDRENLPLQQLFIQLLEAHIRFEERILFPNFQEHFPEKLEVNVIHPSAGPACPNDADWLDHFWLASKA